MNEKPKVLVICTGNSMRSQLAEGMLRMDLGDYIEVFSAGTHPSSVHPLTIQALEAAGVDASKHYSKGVGEFLHQEIDLVITVCDHANDVCPYMPNARKHVHRGYPDPIRLRPGQDPAQVFSSLRDQIREELRDVVIEELNLKVKRSS